MKKQLRIRVPLSQKESFINFIEKVSTFKKGKDYRFTSNALYSVFTFNEVDEEKDHETAQAYQLLALAQLDWAKSVMDEMAGELGRMRSLEKENEKIKSMEDERLAYIAQLEERIAQDKSLIQSFTATVKELREIERQHQEMLQKGNGLKEAIQTVIRRWAGKRKKQIEAAIEPYL